MTASTSSADEVHASLGDRPDSVLRLGGRTDLADQHDVERRAECVGDLEPNRDAAPRKREDQWLLISEAHEDFGKPLARVSSATEQRQAMSH